MLVTAGYADLFAIGIGEDEGPRQQLFQVDAGEVILPLHDQLGPSAGVRVIAVGGPGAEAAVLPMARIENFELIAAWIAKVGKVIVVPTGCSAAPRPQRREVCPASVAAVRRAGSSGLRSTRASRDSGAEPAYQANSPPAPLTAGMWIEAGRPRARLIGSPLAPSGVELWDALDQFHLCAMACMRRRLAAGTERAKRTASGHARSS
jgi:hypothetical protein